MFLIDSILAYNGRAFRCTALRSQVLRISSLSMNNLITPLPFGVTAKCPSLLSLRILRGIIGPIKFLLNAAHSLDPVVILYLLVDLLMKGINNTSENTEFYYTHTEKSQNENFIN